MRLTMRSLLRAIFAVAVLAGAGLPALAQWQVPDHSVPIGRGTGTGFKFIAPCLAGIPIVGAGVSADPVCGSAAATSLTWTPTGTGGTARTVASALQERGVTPTDYGAVANSNAAGVAAANATAFARAFAASGKVYCKSGDTYFSERIVIPVSATRLDGCTIIAGGSYSASTAVLSVIGNAAGLVIDNTVVSVDVSTYPTINGILLSNTSNAIVSNSSLSGAFPLFIGRSVNTQVRSNVLGSATFGRGIFASSDGSAAVTATLSIASPMVVTKTAHGLVAGDTVILYSTGALPSGPVAGRVYYVIASGLTANTFQVSATAGGSAINSSGSQSGTQYYTSNGPRGLNISGNTIYKSTTSNSQAVVLLGASDAIVANNIISGSAHFGISSSLGARVSITGNVVSYSVKEAIHTDSGVDVSITDNQITFDASSTDVGISVSSDNGPPAFNNHIEGNLIDSPAGTCVYLVGSVGGTVQANKLRNCNSANSTLSASIALDGSVATGNTIGRNTITDSLGFNAYQAGESNYTGGGTPSNNFISQQLGTAGATGYILRVTTTDSAIRATDSAASTSTTSGFRFGSAPFALRDTGSSGHVLYNYEGTVACGLNSALVGCGATTHRFSAAGFGSHFAFLDSAGWRWTNVAAPSTPASGTTAVYVNSSTKGLETKDDAGTVKAYASAPSTVQTWLTTPSSANLAAALTDETGTGAAVFANSPTLVTPALGTPSSVTLTNGTGLPIGGVSGLGTGIATYLATPSSANLAAALTDETGTGAAVFANAPTLVNPVVGTQTPGDNTTKAASTAFVTNAVSAATAGVSSFNGLTGAVVFKTPGLVNGKIVESHASNAATFALKTLAGSDPSAGDPVFAVFPDGSALTITAALSFTLSSGSTVGATNSVAFRLWFVLFNDSGTARIGAQKAVTASGIKGFPGHGLHSSTAEGGAGAADSAGVTYTGTAVTSKPFIPIAFADYNSGLSTAGTWAASPTTTTIWTQGMALPGQALQSDSSSTSTQTTSTSSTYISTGASVSMTLSSPCNAFSVYAETDLAVDVPSIIGAAAIRSGGATLGKPKTTFVASGTPAFGVMQFSSAAMGAFYAPGDVSSHTFAVGVALVFGSGTATAPTSNGGAVISVSEVMG